MMNFYKLGALIALEKLAINPESRMVQRGAKPVWDLGGKTPSGFRQPAPPSNVGERASATPPGTGPSTPSVRGNPNPPSPGGTPFSSPVPNIGEADVPNLSTGDVKPAKPVPVKTNPAPMPKTPSAGGTTDVGGTVAATSGPPIS